MENLLKTEWFGRYWSSLMLHDRTLWIAVAVAVFLVLVIMRRSSR